MGIYLPYHCFSRLCRKLAKPRVINRVEQVSGNCVKDHRCLASTRNKKDTHTGVFFISRCGSENQPLETALPFHKALRVATTTSTDLPQSQGSIPFWAPNGCPLAFWLRLRESTPRNCRRGGNFTGFALAHTATSTISAQNQGSIPRRLL